jgi:hypothetical protein
VYGISWAVVVVVALLLLLLPVVGSMSLRLDVKFVQCIRNVYT